MNIIIGIGGMIFILTAFILDEFISTFNQNTWQYNALNIIGSGLLAYYAFTIQGWPFLILNVIWLAVAVIKSAEILAGKRGGRRGHTPHHNFLKGKIFTAAYARKTPPHRFN